MAERSRTPVVRDRLPPREVWLYDPSKEGLLETPLDERGLVDLDALVDLAKNTVDSGFGWQSRENDIHHLQWPHSVYSNGDPTTGLFIEFRELVNRKAYVPRIFHNWIHRITYFPPVPSVEVMRYSVDAQRVAMSLARTASMAVQLTRRRDMTDRVLQKNLDYHFLRYNLFMENAREVPHEFRLLALDQIEARMPEDLLTINKKLGKRAIDRIPVVRRRVQQTA